MNDDMHPHWHATEEDGNIPDAPQSIPVRRDRTFSMPTVSRLPAAVVGILVVLFIGTLAVGDVLPKRAQVSPGSSLPVVDIHIKESGFVPPSATVSPGQTIRWINEQEDLPHILQSETLRDGSGNYLYSPPIFTGDPYSFTLATDQEAGSFNYVSMVISDFEGTIVVLANTSSFTSQTSLAPVSSAPAPSPTPDSSSSIPTDDPSLQGTEEAGAADDGRTIENSGHGDTAISSLSATASSSSSVPVLDGGVFDPSQIIADQPPVIDEPPATDEPIVAICGNGVRESGEECETDWDCSGDERERCEACSCIPSIVEPDMQQQEQFPERIATDWNTSGMLADSTTPNAAIPVNPYALGIGGTTSSVTLPGEEKQAKHAAAPTTPRPYSQPQTGPTIWVTMLGSCACIVWMTRRTPRAITSL